MASMGTGSPGAGVQVRRRMSVPILYANSRGSAESWWGARFGSVVTIGGSDAGSTGVETMPMPVLDPLTCKGSGSRR